MTASLQSDRCRIVLEWYSPKRSELSSSSSDVPTKARPTTHSAQGYVGFLQLHR